MLDATDIATKLRSELYRRGFKYWSADNPNNPHVPGSQGKGEGGESSSSASSGGKLELPKDYKTLPDNEKTQALRDVVSKAKSSYKPVGELKNASPKGKALNSEVGRCEGIARAYTKKASGSDAASRALLHSAMGLYNKAQALAKARDEALEKGE